MTPHHTPAQQLLRHLATPFALALALQLVACAPSEGALQPRPYMQMQRTCVQTACEARQSSQRYQCDECRITCRWDEDCRESRDCRYICMEPQRCQSGEGVCVEHEFEAVLPNDPSPEVAEACERVHDHAASCGYEADASICHRFARIEHEGVAANYRCSAELSCDELVGSDVCDRPPTRFGSDLCGTYTALCDRSACSTDEREWLDRNGDWLREDVRQVAVDCTGEPLCDDVRACIRAWIAAVVL